MRIQDTKRGALYDVTTPAGLVLLVCRLSVLRWLGR